MITANICLSDIPKERIREANGKKYCNIVLDTLREVDDKGNTHSVYMSQTKEERTAKVKKQYIGRGKDWNAGKSQQQPPAPAQNDITEPIDDLPF